MKTNAIPNIKVIIALIINNELNFIPLLLLLDLFLCCENSYYKG
jgi:hypothetical protein